MSTMSIDAGTGVRTGTRRSGRGSARRVGPTLRPGRGVPAPELRREAVVPVAGCEVAPRPLPELPVRVRAVSRPVASTVRLTERGIAVVLVTGVMIAVAALTVVGATAARVTSDGYHGGTGSLQAANR